jgi:uncharacterized protein (DUF885 family)
MLRRRQVIAGCAALGGLAAARAWAAEPRDTALREMLDRAALLKPPEAALALVEAFDSGALSPVRRLEYRAVREGLQREQRKAAATEPQAVYAATLIAAFGRDADPRQAHTAAQAQIAALQNRADTLLKAQGLGSRPVGRRIETLMREPAHLFTDDDAGRDQAVAFMNGRLAAILPKLPRVLGDLPAAPAEARRMSRADEAAGKGGFRQVGAGGAPGTYCVDLKDIRSRPRWTLPAVVCHELIPGHLLQLPLQAAADPHPLRLRFANAYFEAWGVYAEQLGGALGVYADPLDEIGYLHWRLFRMARLLADTGMGAMGWSRQQAIDAMATAQGPPIAFARIEQDVDRMTAQAALYAGQGLGALAFERLAQGRSGARLIAWHRATLADGPWPFDILTELARLPSRPIAALREG